MKKYLSLLLVLMILISGCSASDGQNEMVADNSEEETVEEVVTPSVVLTINPSIELFYDESYNVTTCEYLNQDGQDAWSDRSVIGKNITEALKELITVAKEKEYLNYDNKDIQITLTKEDSALQETISQMIDEYVEASDTSVIASLEQIDENNNAVVLSTAEKDTDAFTTENIAGIWVSEEWVNPSIKLEYYNPNYTRTLVFMEDGAGVIGLYVSENGANFSQNPRTFYEAFSWSFDGWIKTDAYNCDWICGESAYIDLFDDLIVIDWGDNQTTSEAVYKYEIRNGKLYQYNSDTEYIVYHKVDSFEEPYVGSWFGPSNTQTMNSMDYTNPKATYDELRASMDIYFDGTYYRNRLSTFTKKDNIYYWMTPQIN